MKSPKISEPERLRVLELMDEYGFTENQALGAMRCEVRHLGQLIAPESGPEVR